MSVLRLWALRIKFDYYTVFVINSNALFNAAKSHCIHLNQNGLPITQLLYLLRYCCVSTEWFTCYAIAVSLQNGLPVTQLLCLYRMVYLLRNCYVSTEWFTCYAIAVSLQNGLPVTQLLCLYRMFH